jgi:Ser/Thr protein kinase RdoA (MazF antagonist)
MTDTIITADQLNSILKDLSLGELATSIEQLTNGWSNFTFKFSTKPDGTTFILRQYRPGTLRKLSRENIEYELNFIEYLHKQLRLPVAPAITPPGLVNIDEQTYVALFPFVCGVKYLDKLATPVRQLWQTLAIGRFLGRMHSNISTQHYPVILSDRCSVNFVQVKYKLIHSCQPFAEQRPDLYRRIRRIIDEHTQLVPIVADSNEQIVAEKILQDGLPVGYIHGDIHDDNVLFATNDEKLAAVLDFDDMYVGPLLIDVAMTVCLWCAVGLRVDFDYARQFVNVYEIERGMRLTDAEWNLLETYCYLTLLNQILFTIDNDKSEKEKQETIDELLRPIEHIAEQENVFLDKIRAMK